MTGTLSKGALIGRGRTADVYAWGETQALKLLHTGWPRDEAELEAERTAAAHAAGAPAPAVHGLVEVEGRFGILFDRADGPSLAGRTLASPWQLPGAARLQAELQARLHDCRPTGLPAQRARLIRKIESARPLPPALRAAALGALAALPDGDSLCHGDFHPENIVLTARGPQVLDWVDATAGQPLADAARSLLLLSLPAAGDTVLTRLALILWRRLYLRRYCQLRRAAPQAVQAWLLPVAAARLAEDIPEEIPAVLALLERLARRYKGV